MHMGGRMKTDHRNGSTDDCCGPQHRVENAAGDCVEAMAPCHCSDVAVRMPATMLNARNGK
jgi:hypothetical protein